MSIHVNDFRWEPGKNDAEYINLLKSSRDDWERIAQKAISKLKTLSKEQKARVMTLEEVRSAWRNRDIAFMVEYNDGGNPVWMLYYGYLSTQEEIMLIDEIAYIHHFDVDGYGVDWRCWTSRSTDAQREAVKWND